MGVSVQAVATHPVADPIRQARTLAHRPVRVVLLVVAIAAMSLVDLYLTLLFLTHTGMSEANPLARAMIAYQSPAILAAWKTMTVVLCGGILIFMRSRRSAELGAWVGAIVLGLLMAHWTRYIDHKGSFTQEMQLVSAEIDPSFVRLGQFAP